MAKFSLSSEDMEKLEGALKNIHEGGEDLVNKVLHDESTKSAPKSIQGLINIGARKKGTHARNSKPFKTDTFNLGFFIKTKGGAAKNKGSWGYLIFPDEGRGIRNPREQNFTERGLEKERPKTVDRLMEVITNKIQEEL